MDYGLSQLTDAEKEALRAFLISSDPKEIARAIGRSHHAVEQRLGRARRKLGVSRTLDAALALARAERGEAWQEAVYATSVRGVSDEESGRSQPFEDGVERWSPPFPTKGRPWNALSTWARLGWIAIGVMLLAVSTMAVVSLGESATRIARQH